MAKYVVKYPNGAVATKYITTEITASPKRTRGKSKILGGLVKFIIREGKLVPRYPGVTRRSAKVIDVNDRLKLLKGKTDHPSVQCAGKPWREFLRCLSKTFENKVFQGYAKESGQEVSASEWLSKI